MNRENVSVIVPTLNEGEVIERLLCDLQPMRDQGWQVIVADGGSTDNTPQRATPYADLMLHSEPGRALQMNAAAAQARHPVLWFVHADSRLDAAVFEQLQSAIRDGAAWGRFDVRLSGAHPAFRVIERMMAWRSRLTGIATGDQAIFVRRSLFNAIGGFPPLSLMEDIAISKRLCRHAWPRALSAPVVASSRRWECDGIVRTVLLMWRLRLQYFLGVPVDRLARDYRSCASPTAES